MDENKDKINKNQQKPEVWYIWYLEDGKVTNKLFPACSDEYFKFLYSLPEGSIVARRF